MKYRRFGKTDLEISEIGFGAWGIGKGMWQGADDSESMRALHKAVDLGVNFIDTALSYGNGHSERLIGNLLAERQERIYIATKVPPKNNRWPAQKGVPFADTFPPEHVIKSTEKSLKNMSLETIDILQLHVWNDEWLNDPDWYSSIESLKKQGKIHFFGVSINDHQPENVLKLIDTGLLDTVQAIFNIFDQSPKEKLLPTCKEKDIGFITRVPLDEGGLTGEIHSNTVFPPGDFRNSYFRGERKKQVEESVHQLKEYLNSEASSLPELALRFCLSWEAVSTVIPGMRSTDHVQENCSFSDGKLLSQNTIQKLAEHRWE